MTKQRKFTPEFKAQVVLEILTGMKSAAQACCEYHLNASTLSRWKQEFVENATVSSFMGPLQFFLSPLNG
ncbi:MAG: transposase [Anaerolineae bacterium]|nr:transposase [Anaerolineae bacterium]